MNQHPLAFVIPMSLVAVCLSAEAMIAPPDPVLSLGPPAMVAPDGLKDAGAVELAIVGREAATEAMRLLRANKHEESLAHFERALYANPFRSRLWKGQGDALQKLGRYREAIESFQTAVDLGGPGWNHYRTMYNIACCHARLNQKDEAFEMLEQVMRTEFATNAGPFQTNSDLDSLRGDPRWKQIVPVDAPEGLTREEGWRFDLDVFEKRITALHYDINSATSAAALGAAIADIRDRVGELSDDGIALEIQRVLAMLGDGHSNLRSWPRDTGPLPVQFYLYSDGVIAQAVSAEHADVVGWRAVRVGGQDVSEVLARIEPYVSRDNRMGIAFSAPFYMSRLAMLRHLGLVEDDDTVEFEFEDHAGQLHTRRLAAISPTSDGASWVRARDGAEAPVPLYLQNQSATYWFKHVPDHDLVYFQFNSIRSDSNEAIGAFMTRLFAYLEKNDVGHLAIDLRLNGGGNSYLNHHLTDELIRAERINQSDRLFVITGRNTFSAAMNLTTDIDIMTNATFVGEPAGSRPNFIGESRVVTLPVSGLQFTCSTRLHMHGMDSTDERMLIAPDYYVPLSSEDYRLNRDPVMDMILEIIKRKRTGKS